MLKKALIAANWKMFKTIAEAVSFAEALEKDAFPIEDREVVIAPPYTALWAVRKVLHREGLKVGAQNCHWEDKGAFTGEISCVMLRDLGCDYVIVGHSERRHLFGETDDVVRRKIEAAFRSQLTPILCVGEVLEEREGGITFDVVGRQMERALDGMGPHQAQQLVVAYEPVWAIGTGKTATPDQAQDVHRFIRDRYAALYDKMIANRVRILYGGSVKPDNVDALMAQPDIDGLLVGGASLDVGSFSRIVQYQTI